MHRLVLRSALFLPRVRIGIAFSFSKSNPSKFTKKNPTVSYDTSTDKELANRVYSCHKLKIESDDAPHFQLAEDLYRTFKEHNHHQRSTKSIDYWLKEHAELIRAISMKKPAMRESLNKQ